MAKTWMNWRSLMRVVCFGGLCAVLAQVPSVRARLEQPSTLAPDREKLPETSLRQIACSITVMVRSQEPLGSGILIHKQGSVYTVVTNDHVLRSADAPYQIQTPDGKVYSAVATLRAKSLDENDLALLQFDSGGADYAIAMAGGTLAPEDEVFAAGFPFSPETSIPPNPPKTTGGRLLKPPLVNGGIPEFVFTTGKVWRVLDKALEGGYQIGYTNDIEKGMSGGPLLNRRGEVVAINGMHAYPLWGDPYVYKDGSQPERSLWKQMSHYSWGIPIKTFLELASPDFAATRSTRFYPTPSPSPSTGRGEGKGSACGKGVGR